jgi:putative ABC transport system ATP-binding protein
MLSESLNKLNSQAADLSNTPLLKVQLLGCRIGVNWQWKHLSFDLYSGERFAVTGSSGSGKTLLLRTLAGLDPIDAGKVFFANRAMSDWYMPEYRTKVVYLSQRPALIEGTVEDNIKVIYQLKIHSQRSYNRNQVLNNLKQLGRNESFLEQPAIMLSGGESQIVALVRALQIEPQLLLLDESTASLDPSATLKVEALVQKWLNAKPNRACIWTSHDPNQLARVTERELILKQTHESSLHSN